MKKIFYLIFAAVITLSSCSGDQNDANVNTKIAKGEVKYGGVFKVNEVSDFKTLHPLSITMRIESGIANQIFEGLVKFNQEDLSIEPALAESWEVNEDATSYTFHIRKGVKFHDNSCFEDGKGREIKATDFKYCFDKTCESNPINQSYWLFKDKVKGAKEYYESTVTKQPLPEGVSGVTVIDDYTIRFDLNYSYAGFLNLLGHYSCGVFPKEAVDTYGQDIRINCVGTGPFRIKTIKESEALILDRNPNYWGQDKYGNQLPYLDGIKYSFNKEKKAELLEFKKGNLDMVFRLPVEMVSDVVGELKDAKKGGNNTYVMQVTPSLTIYYLGFQHKLPPFDNVDVRKAFNYAIDRESIVTYTLQGEGRPATGGIVPPAPKYDIESIKGYEYSPEKAKEHLAKAGYKNGEEFPEIAFSINPGGGERNLQIAEVVQKMISENLGVSLKIEQLPFAQNLEKIESGKAIFWRAGWSADYPDPENTLNILYGGHVPEDLSTKCYVNSMRYQNPVYDSILDLSNREIDETKRFELYKQADQIQLNDAATMPITYDENTRLLQIYVKNFPSNAMEYRDFTEVYFDHEDE